MSDVKTREQVPCWLTYTNETTHQILRDNMHRAPMANGMIEGIGVKTALSLEKFHVDVLGNIYPAPPEKRRGLA